MKTQDWYKCSPGQSTCYAILAAKCLMSGLGLCCAIEQFETLYMSG